MTGQTSPSAWQWARAFGARAGLGNGRFRLLRYYTITTLIAFVAVAAVLFVLQRGEEAFFDQVQREQLDALTQAQAAPARQNEAAARESLLAMHEANHVNLTRLVANLLWVSDFGPLVQRAQVFDVRPCRALPDTGAARRACHTQIGRRILEQTTRIAAMMRQVFNFTAAKGAAPEWVDVNAMVKAVCDFHAFDRRFRTMPIEFVAGPGLPASLMVPDQLNEVLMTVLQGYADSVDERRPCAGVRVQTRHADGTVVIALACGAAREECDALARLRHDGRLAALQGRMQAMGASLIDEGHAVQIHLAASSAADAG